ncbi:hypothetical protein BJX66DRAFT_348879 [Aspergillus keveii]|uniref:Uncharacterized protein n=1 Tax=Aspergillus keveii TaxID=714993 RepID=A0ABR4GDX1_9EURO
MAKNFDWKATQPGRWERDVDEIEEFYTSLAKFFAGTGRVFFAMTGFISLSVPVESGSSLQETETKVEKALAKAWVRLRYDHPTIASRVQYNVAESKYQKVYETFSDTNSEDNWVKETFRIVEERVSGLDWCNSDPPVPDFPTLFLVKPPSTDEGVFHADLVLRSHHDIIDGMGTLLLFNNLFTHAAQAYETPEGTTPMFGDEYKNLSPPLRVAAGLAATLEPELENTMKDVLEYNAAMSKGVEVASPPFNKANAIPGKHQRVAITLSAETTSKLQVKCRSLGLSVTHAYHAAIALAVRDLQERKDTERSVRYISYCLINERHHCNDPYGTSAHPASVYHSVSGRGLSVDLAVPATGSTLARSSKDEFIPIAQHMRDYYIAIRNNTDHIKLVPSYWAMKILPRPKDDPPAIPPRNETPSASISSMGVLDNVIRHRYGSFSVDSPWVTGEEMGSGLGLFLDTWKGRLTLSAAYNDAWHGKDEVLGVLGMCNDIVLGALGVE